MRPGTEGMRCSGAERFEGVEGPTMARHIFMCIYIRYTRAHVASPNELLHKAGRTHIHNILEMQRA